MNYLPSGRLCAQAEDEHVDSVPIEMVVNPGTRQERHRLSYNGIVAPITLLPNEPVAISLYGLSDWKGIPVGIAALDGGAVLTQRELAVDNDGVVSFAFDGGNSPGLYRVLVTVDSQQYHLQLYVAKQQDLAPNCQEP